MMATKSKEVPFSSKAKKSGCVRLVANCVCSKLPSIVKSKDETNSGENRTKRVILEIYDEMKASMENGLGYETKLDYPSADERFRI